MATPLVDVCAPPRSFECPFGPEDFPSLDEAKAAFKEFGRVNGFAVAVLRSWPSAYTPRIVMKCVKGGQPLNLRGITPLDRQRERTSQRSDCPFQATYIAFEGSNGPWTVEVTNPLHNHPPQEEQYPHHSHRTALTAQERSVIVSSAFNGTRPSQIADTIRGINPHSRLTLRDISNALQRERQRQWGPASTVQACLDWLNQHPDDWRYQVHADADGRLDRLAFLNAESMRALKQWHSVIVLDCTYKTNQYQFPLLNIMGLGAGGKTFTAGYALIRREVADDYRWALQAFIDIGDWPEPEVVVTDREQAVMNAVRVIWPAAKHVLCRWHIEQAINKKAKEIYARHGRSHDADDILAATNRFLDLWKPIFHGLDHGKIKRDWLDLAATFSGSGSAGGQVIQYINKTWWPHHRKFLLPFINDYRHLGARTTGWAEGAHSRLKRQLVHRQSDITNIVGRLATHVATQQREYRAALAADGERSLIELCRIDFFAAVLGQISNFALRHAKDEWSERHRNSTTLNPDCGCAFATTMGIPCRHRIKALLATRQVLQVHHFASQWQLHASRSLINGTATRSPRRVPRQLGDLPLLRPGREASPDRHAEYEQLTQEMNDAFDRLSELPRQRMAPPLPPRRVQGAGGPRTVARMAASGRILNSFDRSTQQLVAKGLSTTTANGKRAPRCRLCKRPGHNARTCTGDLPPSAASSTVASTASSTVTAAATARYAPYSTTAAAAARRPLSTAPQASLSNTAAPQDVHLTSATSQIELEDVFSLPPLSLESCPYFGD